MRRMRITHASFDVFDTLLTRIVGDPADTFLFLGARLRQLGLIDYSCEIFARQRTLAEARAFSIVDCHPTLEQVYRELLHGMNRPELSPTRFAEQELLMESRFLRAVPGAAELLEGARQQGLGVVFVTDTNMSSDFIAAALQKHGLFRPGDRIFASCDTRVDKARGLMFPHVAKALGLHPSALRHHGNSAVADVRNARLSGWGTAYRGQANLNRYEQALVTDSFATGGMSSLLAGCCRLARLQEAPANDRERTIATTTAGVMAPTLLAWMIWLLRRAHRDGCKRLYFVSRDGEVLLEIARQLTSLLQTPLELSYLYVGRQALLLAGSAEAALRDLLRLPTTSLADVAESLGLTDSQLREIVPESMQDLTSWSRPLTADERVELRVALGKSRDSLNRASAAARDVLTAYLEQEGWASGDPFAVVDVGWRASMAGTLTDVLRDSHLRMPDKFYYFGLGNDAHAVAGKSMVPRLNAWFYDDATRHGLLPYLAGTSSLVEMFCAGGHGSVTGYEHTGDGIRPKLRSPISPMQTWGLPLMRRVTARCVAEFVAAFPADLAAQLLDVDLRHSIDTNMRLFWLHPTPAEVEHWGTYPVQVNLTNSRELPLAERISLARVLRTLAHGSIRFRSNDAWPRGSELRSPFPVRQLLVAMTALRVKGARLRRRLIWLRARLTSSRPHISDSSESIESAHEHSERPPRS